MADRLAPRKAPTILDVASLAEVSKSTVSNVVRGVAGVSPRTRRRVVQAIQDLGYRPNVLARQLVQQRTTILGVVVGDLANPFFAEMAKLIEREAARAGYTAMFCNTEGDEGAELAGVETLLEHRVAGIIFLAHSGGPSAIEAALAQHVPVVFVSCEEDWGDSVTVDDRRGGRLATEHLIGLGHRRIAFLTSSAVDDRADSARQQGYREALADAGLGPGLIVRWEPPAEAARIDNQRLSLGQLFGGADPVTAVFASNDLSAIDLLEFADRAGLRVPDDLSVVGFDNVALASLSRISLTTVAQPRETLARLGLETLAGRLQGENETAPRRLVVDAELVIRGSTCPPPPGSTDLQHRPRRSPART